MTNVEYINFPTVNTVVELPEELNPPEPEPVME